MTDALVIIIFGWPAIIVSILLSVVGVLLKRPGLLVAAGFIGLPFGAYVTASSHTPGLLLPLLHFGAAYAIKREKTRVAWLLILPMILAAVLLAYVVLTQ